MTRRIYNENKGTLYFKVQEHPLMTSQVFIQPLFIPSKVIHKKGMSPGQINLDVFREEFKLGKLKLINCLYQRRGQGGGERG